MKNSKIYLLLPLGLMLSSAASAFAADASECSYNKAEMLKLDWKAFDQDMNGGWRKLEAAGCAKEAADLIRDWRIHNKADNVILFWHEGQLRAMLGQYGAAIKLFQRSRKTESKDAGWGWNFYVEGSIEFLKGRKAKLVKARQKLADLPRPQDLANTVDVEGNPVEVEWPMNLNVLDAFIRCWGQSYKQAYACPLEVK